MAFCSHHPLKTLFSFFYFLLMSLDIFCLLLSIFKIIFIWEIIYLYCTIINILYMMMMAFCRSESYRKGYHLNCNSIFLFIKLTFLLIFIWFLFDFFFVTQLLIICIRSDKASCSISGFKILKKILFYALFIFRN